MIVMKFGGTSVEDAKAIQRVAQIVRGRLKSRPVVVVSAMGGVTDSLVRMADRASRGDLDAALSELQAVKQRHYQAADDLVRGKDLLELTAEFGRLFDSLELLLKGVRALGELSPRTSDAVLSFGEVLSSVLIATAFRSAGLDSVHVDSRKVIVTDASHKGAAPDADLTKEKLQSHVGPLLSSGKVPVMGGFIGATREGVTTTLGRGGSDFSAAIVGAALSAGRVEIWTDVEGMLTTDPRLCPDAHRIRAISFDEAAELAYFGAKVLHPATLLPAVQHDIPVYVLNSRNVKSTGTCIRSEAPPSRTMFRAIAAKKGVNVINVKAPRMLLAYGFLKSLFEILERHRCPVDLVSTSEVSVSLVVDPRRDIAGIVPELKQLGEVEVESGKAIVCLVGRDIKGRVGIAATVFNVLASTNVNAHMISQGASEINISVVIDEGDIPRAVKALHDELFTKPLSQRARRQKIAPASARNGERVSSYKLAALSAGGDD